ncbi:MAG: type II toxin-antitoxin system VapB family antitoxin [Mesorhizobium sp.]
MSDIFPPPISLRNPCLRSLRIQEIATADYGYAAEVGAPIARNMLDFSESSLYIPYKQVDCRMALSIKNMEVEQMARELARRRRVSVTEAIRQSLEREVARERLVPRPKESDLLTKLREISDQAGRIPRISDMTDDEILGYDEFGIPTR